MKLLLKHSISLLEGSTAFKLTRETDFVRVTKYDLIQGKLLNPQSTKPIPIRQLNPLIIDSVNDYMKTLTEDKKHFCYLNLTVLYYNSKILKS